MLWALSHPLHEKAKTGAAPCKLPGIRRTKQDLQAAALKAGTYCDCTGRAVGSGCSLLRAYVFRTMFHQNQGLEGNFEALKYFVSFFLKLK